jgi:hypothetical protein
MIRDVESGSHPIRLPVVSDEAMHDLHCLRLHSSARDPLAYLTAGEVIELADDQPVPRCRYQVFSSRRPSALDCRVCNRIFSGEAQQLRQGKTARRIDHLQSWFPSATMFHSGPCEHSCSRFYQLPQTSYSLEPSALVHSLSWSDQA